MTKKALLITSLIIMVLDLAGYAQDCTLYFPADEGTILEVEHFDRRGNLTGSALQKIVRMETSGSSTVWTVQNTIKDDKGEELMENEMTFECRDESWRCPEGWTDQDDHRTNAGPEYDYDHLEQNSGGC